MLFIDSLGFIISCYLRMKGIGLGTRETKREDSSTHQSSHFMAQFIIIIIFYKLFVQAQLQIIIQDWRALSYPITERENNFENGLTQLFPSATTTQDLAQDET